MASALSVGPEDRASFVGQQAGGDEDLRREVLSLLESNEEAGAFLEPTEPAGSCDDEESEPEPDLGAISF